MATTRVAPPPRPKPLFVGPRWRATYRGETLGWYDTAEQAEAAVAAARAAERAEEGDS